MAAPTEADKARLRALPDPADRTAAATVLERLTVLEARTVSLMELDEALEILRDQAANGIGRPRRAAALVLADYDRLTGARVEPVPTGGTP